MTSPNIPQIPAPPNAARWSRWVGLSLLLVFLIHVPFVAFHRGTFTYDDSWYGETSLRFLDKLSREGIPGAYDLFSRWSFSGMKAPLIILAPQPFLLIFGRHDATFLLTNLFLLLVACAYLRALARLYLSRLAADLVVLTFALMPMTAYLTRAFFVEILLTAVTLAFIYHAVRSEGFTCRKHSILTGVAFGLGMLAKVTFPLYICGVFALILFRYLRANREWIALPLLFILACLGPAGSFLAHHHKHETAMSMGLGLTALILIIVWFAASRRQANLFIAASLALWTAMPWYLYNAETVFKYTYSASVGEISKDYGAADMYAWAPIRDFWIGNVNYAFGVAFVAALAVMLVVLLPASFIRAKPAELGRKQGVVQLIVLWLLPALIAFTLGRNRTTRFLMPLLPGAAILYGAMFQRLCDRVRFLAYPLGGAHLLAAGYVFLVLTIGGRSIAVGPRHEFIVSGPELTILGPLKRSPFPLGAIVESAARLAPIFKDRDALVMSLTDTVHVNQNTLSYTAAKLSKPVFFGMIPYGPDAAPAMEALRRADLLVYQEGGKDDDQEYI